LLLMTKISKGNLGQLAAKGIILNQQLQKIEGMWVRDVSAVLWLSPGFV
jgi:hypothetical protein